MQNATVSHMPSAMGMRQALYRAEARATAAETMADANAMPTFLLSIGAAVLHANAAARELLREADGLIVEDGALTSTRRSMRKPLRSLLLGVHSVADASAGLRLAKPLSLERNAGRRPMQLLASPVSRHGGRGILLLAGDPEKTIVLCDEVLREHYGMTPAETEVANGLLSGYSLEEIGALRKVATGTVRQQMKSMLSKTGTGRQADMVRLLLTLPRMDQ